MTKILSIIIPIYNVEIYIKRCLDSIYDSLISEDLFEVIAVNDGSQDDSVKIVENFSKSHTNLRIFNKNNEGVSSARNLGINVAQGHYLLFVDADDCIFHNSLKTLISTLNNNNDVFILRSYKENSCQTENYKWKELFYEKQTYTGDFLLRHNYVRGSVCGCAFRRLFIHNNKILFPKGIKNFEDTIFMMLVMCYANSIRFADIDLYKVFVRAGSASTSINRNNVLESVNGLKYIEEYMQTHNLNTLQTSILEYLKYSIISNATLYSVKCKNLGYKDFITHTEIKRYLPIKLGLVKQQNNKIKILNASYWLYYILIFIKNQKFFHHK